MSYAGAGVRMYCTYIALYVLISIFGDKWLYLLPGTLCSRLKYVSMVFTCLLSCEIGSHVACRLYSSKSCFLDQIIAAVLLFNNID